MAFSRPQAADGVRTGLKGDMAIRCGIGSMGANLLLTNFCLHLSHLVFEAFVCGLLLQSGHETINDKFDPSFLC